MAEKDWNAVYARLTDALATMPDLDTCELKDPSVQRWLANAGATFEASLEGLSMEQVAWNSAVEFLPGARRPMNAHKLRSMLHAAIARIEAKGVKSSGGAALIAQGDKYGAFVKIVDICRSARAEVWIVDPYMEDRALREFGAAVPDGVTLRLLANKKRVNDVLEPAANAWRNTTGQTRTLHVRRADSSALHDRFIAVDQKQVWLLSQSLNAFAEASPATVIRFDDALAVDKLAAYEAIWSSALTV